MVKGDIDESNIVDEIIAASIFFIITMASFSMLLNELFYIYLYDYIDRKDNIK